MVSSFRLFYSVRINEKPCERAKTLVVAGSEMNNKQCTIETNWQLSFKIHLSWNTNNAFKGKQNHNTLDYCICVLVYHCTSTF